MIANDRNDGTKFQTEFLQRLGRRFKSRGELVRTLSETLNVGRDAVYRRLRGETILGADEMMLLARTFRIRIGEGSAGGDFPTLIYPNTTQQTTSEVEYFARLRHYTAGLTDLTDLRVDYASSELPLFYELSTPTLRAFKIYIYSLSCWKLAKWEGLAFRRALISPEAHTLAQDILRDAYQINGRELWSVGILDTTLRQISYVAETGMFSSEEELREIFAELRAIVDHLEKMVRAGRRFPPGEEPDEDSPRLNVYHNELSNTNNSIIINSVEQTFMFSTLINPNYLVTYDERIINDVQQWFDGLVESGSALSADSGKYTTRYFNQLRQKIDSTWERISFSRSSF